MSELKKCCKTRDSIKSRFARFATFVNSIKEKETVNELDCIQISERLSAIQQVKLEFDELQNLIETLVKQNQLDEEYDIRDKIEKEYYTNLAIAKKIIKDQEVGNNSDDNISLRSHVTNNFQSGPNSNGIQSIKLPTISLPKYNGIYQNWLEFRDTFRSLIHDNSAISNVQKFHYLRASLEGDASSVIKSLELSCSNYEVAWNTLLERYDNDKLLIYNHVKTLFNTESISKESAGALRKLSDDFSKNLRALEQLNQPVAEWDTILVYLISTKLDNVTLREWENFKADLENPKFGDIKSFLKSRADMLEMVSQNQPEKRKIFNNSNRNNLTRGFISTDNSNTIRPCVVCNDEHYIQNCQNFLDLSPGEREKKVRSLRLCINCLKRGHHSKICRRGNCTKCNAKHHSLLHRDGVALISSDEINDNNVSNSTGAPSGQASVILSACDTVNHVLLSTAYVQVSDQAGSTHIVRALLDNGAQSSFITKNLCKKLKLKTQSVNMAVTGLNNALSNIDSKCELTVQALYNSFSFTKCFFLIDEISGNIPAVNIDVSKLTIPPHINLADPTFYKPSNVEMLIGSDMFWEILSVGQISLGNNSPILQKTKFGWIISGPLSSKSNSISCHFSQNVQGDSDLQKCLLRFWEVEEVNTTPSMSSDEIECENNFIKNTTRDRNGRFIVSIPLKEPVEKLGESYDIAKKRFLALERKFENNAEFKKLYREFMHEYLSLGHMEKVENMNLDKISYYMPHHGVLKADSLSTKLRVVFDASAPTTTGYSLNNLQYVGPTIQNGLFSILLRFRQHKYVICADIAKMYRQVLINPEQRSLQRILWRESSDLPLNTYEMKTVTYGTTAGSFLAIRCLFHLAEENKKLYPKIANIIKTDFYVDDLLSGANTIDEASQLCRDLTEILKQGCFELRKFYSNDKRVLKHLKNNCSDLMVIDFSENENAKTLGITWNPTLDKLVYKISVESSAKTISKRSILSNIAQIFDPLGLLSPCVILAKILLQKIWLQKVSWDETVPIDIYTSWREYRSQLPILNNMLIERRVICNEPIRVEMHGFSDASEEAYGACIYIRSIDKTGEIYSQLICAKSKVAPLKQITLPKLELMGALVLARLADQTRSSLRELTFHQCFFWSDSTIVLGWLKQPPNKLKTFVSNRVSEIQQLTISDSWNHVPSKQNPADLLSRGLKPQLIVDNKFWWEGPVFLRQDSSNWPKPIIGQSNLPDIRKSKTCTFSVILSEENFINKYSDLNKLQRITAYLFRFYNNCKLKRQGHSRRAGSLDNFELIQALKGLIRISQFQYFEMEISKLKRGRKIGNSKIVNLNPFIDHENILRVGGRLNNAQFCFEKKHPAILAADSHLAHLIARHTHLRLLHAGPQHTLAALREEYWIVGGRVLIKSIVRKCIPCFRYRPKISKPIMAPLPEMRLTSRHPFEVVGVDYAGPILIKSRSGRGFKISKAYICLFICCVTKAAHIELVTELTKECFLLALKRFVSRRGTPTCIYSDNGSNFIAASHDLHELGKFILSNENCLTDCFMQNYISWKFIPPQSPHFGGLWESGIKSIKHHLKRVTKDLIMSFEQLYTVLVEVEAILNSRPLSPLSDSPHDLVPLTPSHFLISRPKLISSWPEPDITEVPTNRLSLYRHLVQIKQHIWQRWSKEYIGELQQRTKWKSHYSDLKINSLVLVKDDNLPVMKWRLGRVESIQKGKDGVARVATLLTSTGRIKRSFSKICPLPLEDSMSQEDNSRTKV